MFRQLCFMVLFVVTFSTTADINGRIVRVLDGDTVEILETDNQLKRVRLAGIDAPEDHRFLLLRKRRRQSLRTVDIVNRTS